MSETPRVVLVTGASSGLGLAMANDLYSSGYRVYGASRKADGHSNPYGSFELISMDVDDDASVAAGIEAVIAREGVLDAVVSNAGMGIAGAIEDTSSEEAERQFRTNFFGNHRVCRAALPHLRARDRSNLIVIGSLAGIIGIPFQGLYSASKFALEGYCESLRIELRKTSVRVTIIEPGDFATGFTSSRQVVAASGEGSIYRETFSKALETIERMEVEGADPRILGETVKQLLEMSHPPLRIAVGDPSQTEIASAKQHISPDELESQIADVFGC